MTEKNKPNKEVTIKQHYVPRFYMKNFSIVRGSGRKEKALISFYQFDKGILKENIQTKSVCYENYFYDEDGKIEKDLSVKEATWSSVIQDIIDSKETKLNKDKKRIIKQFASFQYARTLAMYNYNKNMINEIIIDGINRSSEIKKALANQKIKGEISPSDMINSCEEFAQNIEDLDISIIKFNTMEKLITSDMPVIMMNPFCIGEAGFVNVGTIIVFPISPEILVYIYDSKIYKNYTEYMELNNEQDVINLNKYQVINSEERILFASKKALDTISNDKELILKRAQHREKNKTELSFQERGLLIGVKAMSTNYYFRLSFCKLPQYIRRIPSDCRRTVPRMYSHDMRMNLLIGAYKVPELLKKEKIISTKRLKKLENGYLEFQRFMDDYWNIPIKDRCITPSLLKKIKATKMTYYGMDRSRDK